MRDSSCRGTETGTLLAKYIDFYDFAPVRYFTLNTRWDHPAGQPDRRKTPGVGRSHLAGQQFRFHLSDKYYSSFDALLRKTFEGEAIEHCELMLLQKDGVPPRHVQLEARLSEDRKECNLVMIDNQKNTGSLKAIVPSISEKLDIYLPPCLINKCYRELLLTEQKWG